MQLEAILHIVSPTTPNQLLLVDRTGGGKTHVTRTAGIMLRGIIIIFIPLLSLSADQHSKFNVAAQRYGCVNAIHLDEISYATSVKRAELLNRISSLTKNTTSTMFLLLSPQFLIRNEDFRKTLIIKANTGVVRLIKIDEVHLYVQHGITFRREICMLKEVFFEKVYRQNNKPFHPFFLAATATMTHKYVDSLTQLTTNNNSFYS